MPQHDDITYHQLRETNGRLSAENLQLKAEIQWYREQLGLAKKRLFGPSSEQAPLGQEAMLFNEAEANAAPNVPEPATETITYTRRKTPGQRDLQLANLPIEEITYDLPEDERVCPACAGALHPMGADTRVEVEIVPAIVKVVKHIRTKYACRHCERNEIKTPILTAPAPVSAFPNSLASPTAVAHIVCQKFVEGSPLYRQEQSFKRLGFELSRQTMANWMLTGAGWLEPVYERMHTHLLARDILHADETTLQVLKEVGRAAASTSYMWLYRSGREGPPIVLYDYQQTREGEHPRRFLRGFCGFLHVDGYVGYEGLAGVTLCGCWAHARRKFVEALNVLPEPVRKKGETLAHAGLHLCDKLFAIERDLREATPEERFAQRHLRSQRVLEDLRVWLDEQADTVLPKSVLGGALSYCRHQWPKLTTFLMDGRLELDNNRSERSIKPFVIGRKNWLFANTARGARSSAILYSMVETAKENGLSPFAYLTHLFEQLPNINLKDPAALDLLLPWSETVQAKCRVPSKPTR